MALIRVEYMYNGKQDHGLDNCRPGRVWDLRIRWRFSGLSDHRASKDGPIGWVFQKIAGSYKVGKEGQWAPDEAQYWEMWEVHMAPTYNTYVATPSLPQGAGAGTQVNTNPDTVIGANHFNDTFTLAPGNPIYQNMKFANGSVYKKEAWVFYVKNNSVTNTAVNNWKQGAAQGGAAGALFNSNTGPACPAVKAMKRVAAVEWDNTAEQLRKWKHLKKPLYSSHRY